MNAPAITPAEAFDLPSFRPTDSLLKQHGMISDGRRAGLYAYPPVAGDCWYRVFDHVTLRMVITDQADVHVKLASRMARRGNTMLYQVWQLSSPVDFAAKLQAVFNRFPHHFPPQLF